MRNGKDNLIVDLTFKFALTVIDYCGKLENKKKYILATQLLKSRTLTGANVREAHFKNHQSSKSQSSNCLC